MSRYLEAVQIWEWIKWRLPADIYMEAQQILFSGPQPSPTDPQLSAGLDELTNPATTRARRLQLLQQLLTIIKNQG